MNQSERYGTLCGVLLLLLGACLSVPAIESPAYYVSPAGINRSNPGPDGSDGNAGTVSAPFLTIAHANALLGGSTKTVYLRGGTHAVTTTINPPTGAKYLGYPGETAIVDGGTTGTYGFQVYGASNVTVRWITFQRQTRSGIDITNSDGSTVDNCTFKDIPTTWAGAAINLVSGATNCTVSHNLLFALGGRAIAIQPGSNTSANFGNTISYNYIHDVMTSQQDDEGAIICEDRFQYGAGHAPSRITNNFIFNYGHLPAHQGIYLDANFGNVVVSNNIVAGTGGHCIQFHGGSNITMTNNIFQLSGSQDYNLGIWQDAVGSGWPNYGATGCTFTRNIIYSKSAAGSYLWSDWWNPAVTPKGLLSVNGNLYFTTQGSHSLPNSGQTFVDPAAVNGVDPLFVGVTGSTATSFALQAASPAIVRLGFSPIDMSAVGPLPNGGGTNHAPVASPQSVATVTNAAKAIALAATDADGDPLTYSIVANPAHGTLGGSAASRTYTPATGYTGADSFTFKANDGTADSNVATVSITVSAGIPVPPTGLIATPGDGQVVLAWTASAGATSYKIYAGTSSGGEAFWGSTATATSYAATGATNGTIYYYQVTAVNAAGESGRSNEAFATAGAVNHPPVANAQSVTTAEDTAKAITLVATDADGNALVYAIVAGPAHGTLAGSGANRTYTPAADYTGADSLAFKANDGLADSNTATVSITVTAVNDAPVVSAASANPSPATGVTANLSATASDVDNAESTLIYTWTATGPAAVAFSPNATNAAKVSTARFTRAGAYTLTATAADPGGATGTRAVALTVAQTAGALSISPTGASVQPLRTVDFNAVLPDQFGAAMATQPALAWTVSGGGTIDANGLFTAGAGTPSPQGGITATTYVVTASGGGQSVTALVTVSTASTATAAGGGSASGCGAGGVAGLLAGLGLLGLMLGRRR